WHDHRAVIVLVAIFLLHPFRDPRRTRNRRVDAHGNRDHVGEAAGQPGHTNDRGGDKRPSPKFTHPPTPSSKIPRFRRLPRTTPIRAAGPQSGRFGTAAGRARAKPEPSYWGVSDCV